MKKRTQQFALGGIALGLILLAGFAVRARVDYMKQQGLQGNCVMHLKQISLALLEYQDRYGSLPPACTRDANGKPLHSWRRLILPFLGGEEVYARYDFDEPWNGPNNSRLRANLPETFADRFRCPTGRSRSGATNYFAVLGPRTLWPAQKPGRIANEMLESQPEVLVIEMPDSEVNWMEPTDIDVDEVISKLNSLSGEMGAIHPRGIQYVDTAQRVHAFPTDFGAIVLRKLLTTAKSIPLAESVDK